MLLRLIKEGKKEQALGHIYQYLEWGKEGDINIEWQDDKGDGTSLLWSVARNWTEIVHILLSLGADPNARSRNGCMTALHSACDHDVSPEIIG